MKIRAAIIEDTPAIMALAEKFYERTHYARVADFDVASAGIILGLMFHDGVILLAENSDGEIVGVLGLVIVPFMFNSEKRSAQEVVWYVEPSARTTGVGAELLAALEPACRAAGAAMIVMMHLPESGEAVGRIYRRMGFDHSETSYTKVL